MAGTAMLVIFVAGFWAAREVRASLSAPTLPRLVQSARTEDGLRYVSADQAIAATRASPETTPVFIDVRTSTEYSAVHIPGSLNIQDFQIPDQVGHLPGDKAWVMYCTCPDDHLAKWAAAAVAAIGAPNAVVLEHGLQGWQSAGGDVAVPDGSDPAVQQGCGCSVGAPAVKLWAIERAQMTPVAIDANANTNTNTKKTSP